MHWWATTSLNYVIVPSHVPKTILASQDMDSRCMIPGTKTLYSKWRVRASVMSAVLSYPIFLLLQGILYEVKNIIIHSKNELSTLSFILKMALQWGSVLVLQWQFFLTICIKVTCMQISRPKLFLTDPYIVLRLAEQHNFSLVISGSYSVFLCGGKQELI